MLAHQRIFWVHGTAPCPSSGPPAPRLAPNEVGDRVLVEVLDRIRIETFFLGPPSAFEGADARLVGLELCCRLDIEGAASDEGDDIAVERIYGQTSSIRVCLQYWPGESPSAP